MTTLFCIAGSEIKVIHTNRGTSAKTLRISTQALVFSAAEYCVPVWSRSPHVKKVEVAISSSLGTIYGCIKPTPVSQLPVLAGIAPCRPKAESSHHRLGTEKQ